MGEHAGQLELLINTEADDLSPLVTLPARLDQALLGATIDAADDMYNAIVARIPRSDGPGPHAQDSWRRRIIPYANGAMVVLFTEDRVAYWYWSGTKAHPIVARFAQALHFWSGGNEYFRRAVKHPGTRPHPYVEQAGAATLPLQRERYDVAISRALSGQGGV